MGLRFAAARLYSTDGHRRRMERTLARTLQARDRRAVPSWCFIGVERRRIMTFNLLDEKWIPVLYADGRVERVGIRTALTDARAIRQIAASNPMDNVALLRFLLALLYWCKGNPPEEGRTTPGDQFPADWFSKLDANKDCFDLLGETKRFYQDDACKGIKAEHTTNYLIHEVPSGTNKWHFRHSTDKMNGLCPACCATGLIRLPVFATSGGKGMTRDSGKSPGINAKPPLYFLHVGTSLAATLRLSWTNRNLRMGTPEWETPHLQLPKGGEVPLMTGLTWLPRRVWLDNPEEHTSACISCGRQERVIRHCVFDGKGSTKTEGRIWHDPHVIYAQSRKGDVISLHAGDALGGSDAAAGQWPEIMAGVLGEQKMNDRSSLWVVGFSTVQNDKYLEAMEYLILDPHPPQKDQESIAKFERWQKQAAGLIPSLVRIVRLSKEKAGSRKHKEIAPMVAAVRPHVEDKISKKAGELLAGRAEAWEQAAAEYGPLMKMIARSLSPGFTTSAVQRRKQIANVLPDMRPKTGSAKKPSRKQGGDT